MIQDYFNEINDEIINLDLMLLDFEKNPNNTDLIHIIFRHAHNLKSYLFSFSNNKLSKLIHSIESNFDLLRKGKIDLHPDLIQISLNSLDHIKENLTNNDDSEITDNLINKLESMCEEEKNKGASQKKIEITLTDNEKKIFNSLDKNLNFFQVDKLINSNIGIEDFNDLFIYQDIKEIGTHITSIPKFQEIHKDTNETILKIYFSSSLDSKELENHIFDPFQQVDIIPLTTINQNNINELLEIDSKELFINNLNEIRLILLDISESLFNLNDKEFSSQKLNIIKNIDVIKNIMSDLKLNLITDVINSVQTILTKYDSLITYTEYFTLFINDFIMFLLSSLDIIKDKFSDETLTEEKDNFLNKILTPFLSIYNQDDNNVLSKINTKQSKLQDNSLDKIITNKDANYTYSIKQNIKVGTDKIDQLFDLVGELITIGSTFTSYEQLKSCDEELVIKNSKELNKIIKEIQEVTISIRMIPLEELFNKMKRLIRDLSTKTHKKINFNIFGQDTEVDKNIIEELANPITHILRNAIDHGIENEETRIKNNKPVEGNISLSAKYDGNHIAIIIEDDGKGLSSDKIYQKALEKGLVNIDKKLTEQEIYKFIFEPGFSTANEISDLSGRGVGMDVVKKSIEKLNGKIFIESSKNKGTKISLKIPLTLAIVDAMLIQVNNTFFAIPLEMINQSFKASSLVITDTPDNNVVSIRNNLYRIIDLNEYFYKKSKNKERYENGIFIIINTSDKNKTCFLVDNIIGQQQVVIKGIDDTMGTLDGITGGMILGNGEIGFIIDVEKIIST
jgi:chemotaxis protein histidine kinase CheA